MSRAETAAPPVEADVCLVLEGTYPYVKGGVSAWVHELIRSLPDLRFALVHVGPDPGAYPRRLYPLPPNVVSMSDLYCRDAAARERGAGERARADRGAHGSPPRSTGPSRVLRGLRRLHLDGAVDAALFDDLGSGDLEAGEFLDRRDSLELAIELYERCAPDASFVDYFWHFRSMHLPLVRLLAAEPPAAATYHALCTGYAGLLAAVWSHRAARPMLLTEHGIYTRERSIELERAAWLLRTRDRRTSDGLGGAIETPTAGALRRAWIRFFGALARCAYARASSVVSLCEASRARQIRDGARPESTRVVPNGIDLEDFRARIRRAPLVLEDRRRLRVGLVGRLVPIKDVVTFVRACEIALRSVDLDVRIFGPTDEDPRYVRRCRTLTAGLGLDHRIRLEQARPAEAIFCELDVLVLTSFSEGQPLVILEAGAAGIPVVASDVGACREMLEGRGEADRRLGPSGIVTPLASPEDTAAAIVRLVTSPELRRAMGAAGRRRVAAFYQQGSMISAYRDLYRGGSWPASAGVSNA